MNGQESVNQAYIYIFFGVLLQIFNFKVEVDSEGEFCVGKENIHAGSDHTNRSVASNQVPIQKSDF